MCERESADQFTPKRKALMAGNWRQAGVRLGRRATGSRALGPPLLNVSLAQTKQTYVDRLGTGDFAPTAIQLDGLLLCLEVTRSNGYDRRLG